MIRHANRAGAKVILAGDTSQLQAVQNGGGMSLLADRLGYVQLAEPARFAAAWERAASLRLRAGDISVLAEYDEHGRITGGDPEETMDAAARAYVAHALNGTDVLLMAADHARRRELSRRIRDDLVHLGLVVAGPAVQIADGARASAGDLIVCTRNDNSVEAGEPGRALANGDLLRIEAVTHRGLLVRRALDTDPRTGERRWTDRQFLYGDYKESELGYAVTCHVAQSRTVHAGLVLITSTEDRQHAYVALTRGTHANHVYVFTCSPKVADPAPGPRPAPELRRFDRVTADRGGQPAGNADADHGAALGVLAQVIGRDGQELSATQFQQRGLSNADHLAILHAIWTAEVTPARERRYRDLLDAALPPGYRNEPSHKAQWLWRTLRAAELAGLDAGEVLRHAVAARSLAGARDVAAVIDARIRQHTGSLVPLPPRPWSEQVPPMADPGRQEYVTQIARLMDERTERIGEHAAKHTLPWAVASLGPVPGDPLDRLEWQGAASVIGAYRELSGWEHPAEPIGPEPIGDAPDKRAAWHRAFAALGPADGTDVRGLPDGMLLHLRDTYPIETAWAPKWVGDELRQVRQGAHQARLAAIRSGAEAAAARRADRHTAAARHDELAASYQAMARAYAEHEAVFAGVMDDRRAWEHATSGRRRLAVAADAELRRRHPGQPFPPLRSAEPEPVTDAERADLQLAADKPIPEMREWIKDLAAGHSAFAGQLAERHSSALAREDLEHADAGPVLASWAELGRDVLLQPPKPEIQPSPRVLNRVSVRQTEMEAAT